MTKQSTINHLAKQQSKILHFDNTDIIARPNCNSLICFSFCRLNQHDESRSHQSVVRRTRSIANKRGYRKGVNFHSLSKHISNIAYDAIKCRPHKMSFFPNCSTSQCLPGTKLFFLVKLFELYNIVMAILLLQCVLIGYYNL